MAWMLVVSDDERFHKDVIDRVRDYAVVGATAEPTACGLVGSLPIERILVDAAADTGRRFLAILRNLPGSSPRGMAVDVVDPEGRADRFATWRSLDGALGTAEREPISGATADAAGP